MSTSRAAIGPGGTIQVPGAGVSTTTPRCGQRLDGHLDVRQARQRVTGVVKHKALGEPRRHQKQAGDELARGRGVDRQLAALDRSRSVEAERQRAAAVVADVDSQLAQCGRAWPASGGFARAGRRRTRPGRAPAPRRRQESHDRACQSAVDRDAALELAWRDEQVGAVGARARHLLDRTPSARRPSIMSAESRECRGARSSEGPSARAARTSSRLVRLFDPGSWMRGGKRAGRRAAPSTGRATASGTGASSPYGLNCGCMIFEIAIAHKSIERLQPTAAE